MDPRISKVYDYLKLNYQRKILLQDLADLVELSAFHFQRLFKQEVGLSPNECLNRIRLERAQHLMVLNPDVSLSDIALDCGFSSLSTFSRAFSNLYAHSPTQFRQQYLDNPANFSLPQQHSLQVDIVSISPINIYYSYTSVFDKQLMTHFAKARSFCEAEGILHPSGKRYGAFTHVPFHDHQNELNYYAGVQILDDPQLLKWEHTFVIPAGRYARFEIQSSYHHMLDEMIRFKKEWLDHQPFAIRQVFGFEEIDPLSSSETYPTIKRSLFVPIQRTN
ncbi:MAG: AraC family transcriptional regulator [Bacteroidota bacterium]